MWIDSVRFRSRVSPRIDLRPLNNTPITMNQFNWMMFRPDGRDVIYLWEGTFPKLIHVGAHEGKKNDWAWYGVSMQTESSQQDSRVFNEVLTTKRKQVFSIKTGMRAGKYQVLDRGTVEYANPQEDGS